MTYMDNYGGVKMSKVIAIKSKGGVGKTTNGQLRNRITNEGKRVLLLIVIQAA